MAIILKRKKSGEADGLLSGISATSNDVLKLLAVVVGILAVGVGVYSAWGTSPTIASPTVVATEHSPEGSATKKENYAQIKKLYREVSRLHAAVLAFRAEKEVDPANLAEVYPAYLSDNETPGNPPDFLEKWKYSAKNLLVYPDISLEVCKVLSPHREPSKLDYGHNELRCLETDGKYSAIYHIKENIPRPGLWHIKITGTYADKLTTWKIISSEGVTADCTGVEKLTDTVVLNEANPLKTIDLCLPAYEIEAIPEKIGLSLLENTEVLAYQFAVMEVPKSILITTQACDFGKTTKTTLKLVEGYKVPTAPSLSCDLKPVKEVLPEKQHEKSVKAR